MNLLTLLFTVGTGGLTTSGDSGVWAHGLVTTGPGGSETLWSTRPDGQYPLETHTCVDVTLPDLTLATQPVMELVHWYDLGTGDTASVSTNNGPLLPVGASSGFGGQSGGWVTSQFVLQATDTSASLCLTSDAADRGDGWYLRAIHVLDGDVIAPTVSPVSRPTDTERVMEPQAVWLSVQDDREVQRVELFWTLNGAEQQTIEMAHGVHWTATFPGVHAGDRIDWHVVASDGTNTTRWPVAGWDGYRTYLAAVTDFGLAETPRVSQELRLRWSPPESLHPVAYYQVSRGDCFEEQIGVLGATIPNDPDCQDPIYIRPLYFGLETEIADLSEPLYSSVSAPDLLRLSPRAVFPGDEGVLRIDVENLPLLSEQVDLGMEGVGFRNIAVVSANTLRADYVVQGAVPPGDTELRIATPDGEFVFDGVEVLDPNAGLQIVDITPQAARQGQDLTLQVRFAEMPDDLAVWATPGIDIGVAETAGDDTLEFPVQISAIAGVGDHTIVFDDGLHRREVGFRVIRSETQVSGCQHGGWVALWPLGLLFLRQRQASAT